MGCKNIEYVSKDGYKGILYDWHNDPYCGWMYQMSIYSPGGREVLHSYNAKPKNIKELIEVVNIMRNEGT